MLVLRIEEQGLPLPPGEYAFYEWYCSNADCDCRRVLLQVISPQLQRGVLATINYGWESAAFYTRWMHGDKQAGREITSASLDPLHPQSELADALLKGFRDYVRLDSFYPQQLQSHYEIFKRTLFDAPVILAPGRTSFPSMTSEEILRQFQHVPDRADFAPYEAALVAATAQRDAITPALIAVLESVSANPAPHLKGHGDCTYLFALYLLAQFRERSALDAFIRFFSLPGENALNLTGDMVTEHGAAFLASVCGGDPAPLLRLAHDENVNEFVRGQAIDGLLVQGVWDERPRDAVVTELRRLFSTLPKPGNAYLWASLVCAVCDYHAPELLPEIRTAFEETLVDEGVIGLDDAKGSLLQKGHHSFLNGERRLARFCERNAPIDAVAECSTWLCFRDDAREEDTGPIGDWEGAKDEPGAVIATGERPYLAPPKVGRNDPCPCGSGKKFKKCCGA